MIQDIIDFVSLGKYTKSSPCWLQPAQSPEFFLFTMCFLEFKNLWTKLLPSLETSDLNLNQIIKYWYKFFFLEAGINEVERDYG